MASFLFAWFGVATSASKADNNITSTIQKPASTMGITLVAEISTPEGVQFSDKNGQIWAVSGGVMVQAGAPAEGAKPVYEALTITPKAYTHYEGVGDEDNVEAQAADLKALTGGVAKSYGLAVTASNRARVTFDNPASSTFATAFGDLFQNTLPASGTTLTFNIAADGSALSISKKVGDAEAVSGSTLTVYYSVSGQANNTVPEAGADASSVTDPESGENWNKFGTITTVITIG